MYLGKNIRSIREYWGLNQTEFGLLIGATRGMIMQYENRGTMPKKETVSRIVSLTGLTDDILINTEIRREDIEPMPMEATLLIDNYRENPDDYELEASTPSYLEKRRNHKLNHVKEDDITVYQMGTKASFIDIYDDEKDEPIGKLNSSVFPGCNHAERISGSSMYPMIFNQAMVVGERLQDARGISSGEIYVIHTNRGLRTCKYVHTIEKRPEEIKLVALNKNVPPQVIPVEDIILIMRVFFIINPS